MRLINYSILSVFSLFLILSLPMQALAQDDAMLRVIVKSNEDGNPIPGAQVMLSEYSEQQGVGEIVTAGVTDGYGLYEFDELDSDTYQFKVTFVGFKDYTEIIEVEEEQRKVKRISLKVDVAQLDEVVVESERDVSTGDVGVEKIGDVEIGRIPTAGTSGDLASYLQTLPGVVMTGDRGGSVHIRGGTPFQNKILVDNLPVTKPFHISNLFSAFPENSVSSVDLYAGGFSAEYLGSSSSVMDVRLSPGNMKEFEGSGALSPYLTSVALEGPIKEGSQSFKLVGRKSVIKQTAPFITGNDEEIKFYDVMGRYSFQGDNYTCNITGLRTFDRGQINQLRNLSLSWQNSVLGARCIGFASNFNHPIEVTAGYSNFQSTEGTLQRTERTAGRSQMFLKVDHEQSLFGASVDYGFEINFNKFSATLKERFTSVDSFEELHPIFRVYALTEWELSDYFTLEPSIGSQSSLVTSPTFEPRFRMAIRPDGTDQQEISLAAGRYFQLMNGITDQRDGGSVFTVLKPIRNSGSLQEALHGNVGYEQHIGEFLEINLEGYIKDYSNISVPKWSPSASLNVETALAQGLAYGYDAKIEYERDPVYFYVGYGWSRVRYEAQSDDLGAWINEPVFSYNPRQDLRHKLNTVGSYEIGGFTTTLSWEFNSGKPYTKVYGFDLAVDVPRQSPIDVPGIARVLFSEPYGERLPPYHRLDVSVEKTFDLSSNLAVDLQVGVLNVYDRQNIFYYDVNTLSRVNQTGRMPYVSLKTQIN